MSNFRRDLMLRRQSADQSRKNSLVLYSDMRGVSSSSSSEDNINGLRLAGGGSGDMASDTDKRDILDLLKLSYVVVRTGIGTGQIMNVSRSANSIWSTLRESLLESPLMDKCGVSSYHDTENCNCRNIGWCDSRENSHGQNFLDENKSTSEDCPMGAVLNNQLQSVMQEGLLDSLLPYLVRDKKLYKPQDQSSESDSTGGGGAFFPLSALSRSGLGDMKIRQSSNSRLSREMTKEEKLPRTVMESNREITIHVCDETRGTKKDFTCPQGILMEKMAYFREITDGQHLDDVDISVHCDIKIFDWLMCWIKHNNSEDKPGLDAASVVSILVSASFLKIPDLVSDCIDYVYKNMNHILTLTPTFSCVGDNLLSQLSSLYKPSEIENLSDRRDRIQSRLYTKMLNILTEEEPNPEKEVWFTAATLYRCEICGKFLTSDTSNMLPCLPSSASIDNNGMVVPKHERDPNFTLSEFIKSLKIELKTWRKVFWRLWGICHISTCSLCDKPFQFYLLEFCSFHPGEPEYPNIQFKNSTLPMGEYPCCGELALRFQPLFQSVNGCKVRDHKIKVRTKTDSELYRTLMTHRDLVCVSYKRNQPNTLRTITEANSISLPSPKCLEVSLIEEPKATEELTGAGAAMVGGGNSKWEALSLVPDRLVDGLVTRKWDKRLARKPKMVLKKTVVSDVTVVNDKKPQPGLNYGRIKRAPRLPLKKEKSSDSSSSSSDNGEDSSCGEEDAADNDDMVGGEDSAEEDKKEVCIQVKLGKEDKNKPAVDNRLPVPESNYSSWDPIRATRQNQDIQRELEDTAMFDIQGHLAGKRRGKLTKNVTADSHNYSFGGSFMRLEQDWRDSHMAYLQHKTSARSNRPISAGSVLTRSRIRTPTIR